jgi:aldehyde:ferredoxin oxidoreductase
MLEDVMERQYRENKILYVDLTQNVIREENIGELRRYYLGGAGMNAKILYDSVKSTTEALSPDNCLCWCANDCDIKESSEQYLC